MMQPVDAYEPMVDALVSVFDERIDDREKRQKAADAIYRWLVEKARKKNVLDLAQRLEKMRGAIDRMVENMEIQIVNSKAVVKVSGSAEDTLKQLRYGSDWYDGTPDIVELAVTGLFDSN